MRDDPPASGPPAFGRWLRCDLSRQHGAILREALPDDMLALLDQVPNRP